MSRKLIAWAMLAAAAAALGGCSSLFELLDNIS